MTVADATLEEIRALLAPTVADAAVFDGWSEAAVDSAATAAGVNAAVARLAFPNGAMDMIAAWIGSVDSAMEQAFSPEDLAALPVRERIRTLIRFRLGHVAGREEALKRALAIMALPNNAATALRIGWNSADAMWRLAGDTATDLNHYSKRAILAGVYAATLAFFADDDSGAKAETQAFLDRRIEGIIRFEKAKGQLFPRNAEHFSITRFLGRLRYPARL
ncbi:MAG: COQ9 family protein [Novosphingobium sp.]